MQVEKFKAALAKSKDKRDENTPTLPKRNRKRSAVRQRAKQTKKPMSLDQVLREIRNESIASQQNAIKTRENALNRFRKHSMLQRESSDKENCRDSQKRTKRRRTSTRTDFEVFSKVDVKDTTERKKRKQARKYSSKPPKLDVGGLFDHGKSSKLLQKDPKHKVVPPGYDEYDAYDIARKIQKTKEDSSQRKIKPTIKQHCIVKGVSRIKEVEVKFPDAYEIKKIQERLNNNDVKAIIKAVAEEPLWTPQILDRIQNIIHDVKSRVGKSVKLRRQLEINTELTARVHTLVDRSNLCLENAIGYENYGHKPSVYCVPFYGAYEESTRACNNEPEGIYVNDTTRNISRYNDNSTSSFDKSAYERYCARPVPFQRYKSDGGKYYL
mmetsp:Transcript_19541/g.21730  ORF Transcript_19541/g.21730 Transcript_19541/m.21730 type:complete len:382 (+) Transcript_19541:53-1198(+)